MTDKDIANTVLEATKHSIEDLTKASLESSGNLKQTLVQMRNQCEQSQEHLAQLAIQKGWYQPAAPANQQDVQTVANFLTSGMREPALRI